MKIVVYGAGHLGGYLGVLLEASGVCHVNLIDLRDRHDGAACVKSVDAGAEDVCVTEEVPVMSCHQHAANDAVAHADAILLCVKAHHLQKAMDRIKACLDGAAKPPLLVCMQSGVRARAIAASSIVQCKVIVAMADFLVQRRGSDYIKASTGSLWIEHDEEELRCVSLFAALDVAGVPVKLVNRAMMPRALYAKLLLDTVIPICALTRRSLSDVYRDRELRYVWAAAIQEGIAVLKKRNVDPGHIAMVPLFLFPFLLRLPNALFTRIFTPLRLLEPHAYPSMTDDITQEEDTEIGFLCADIATLGTTTETPTPINDALTRLTSTSNSPVPTASLMTSCGVRSPKTSPILLLLSFLILILALLYSGLT